MQLTRIYMKQAITFLEQHNLRKTPSRIELLAIFLDTASPLDVSEIMRFLQERKVTIDQATVYRMLDSFVEHDIVTRLEFQEGKYRYELTGSEHHHLICTSCAKIEDISDCNLAGIEAEIRLKKGFLVKRHSLEFFGLCANCQE